MAKLSVDVITSKSGSGLQDAARELDTLDGKWRDVNGRLRDANGRFASVGDDMVGAASKGGGLISVLDGVRGALGASLVGAASDAGQAILKVGADSVEAASNLQQASGGAAAVFGENFSQIQASANTAANSLGLSKAEYLELSTVLGAGLKNQGLDDFAGKTQDVVRLGADLAAQYGGSTKEAVEAIGSLMRGEADPIERYGVSIKQSGVSAELAKQGLDKLEGSAKTQAEAQARLTLLFDQTKDAQGAFSRETDTLATKQQQLNAKWEDTKASIGDKLLPVLTQVSGAFLDVLNGEGPVADALEKLGGWLEGAGSAAWQGLTDAWHTIEGAFRDAGFTAGDAQGALDMLEGVGGFLADTVGVVLMGGFRLLGSAIGDGIRLAGQIRDRWRELQDWAGRVDDRVAALAGKIGSFPLGPFGTLSDLIRGVAGAAQDALRWVGDLIAKVGEVSGISGVVSGVMGVFQRSATAVEPGQTGWSVAAVTEVRTVRPVVNVSIDGLTLRSVIRQEVRAAVAATTSSGGMP